MSTPLTDEALAELQARVAHMRQGSAYAQCCLADDLTALLAEVDRLKTRLTAAEAVALMFGWSPIVEGKRYDACYELWCIWSEIAGADFLDARNHPELSDERIAELAAKRQAEYEAKLARLRGETP